MTTDQLVHDLLGEFGESLRTVSKYTGVEYELIYHRDSLIEPYSEEDRDQVFSDLLLQGLSWEFHQDMFYAGSLECISYVFEEAAMFHFRMTEREGMFITIDTDTDFNLLRFVNICRRQVGTVG